MAVRVGLLLGTAEKVHAPTTSPYLVLDKTIAKSNNGKAFQVFDAVIPVRSRIR